MTDELLTTPEALVAAQDDHDRRIEFYDFETRSWLLLPYPERVRDFGRRWLGDGVKFRLRPEPNPVDHGMVHTQAALDHARVCFASEPILRSIAEGEPLTTNVSDGLSDHCFFCGADARTVRDRPYPENRFAHHEIDCAWVAARQLLGIDLGIHTVAL